MEWKRVVCNGKGQGGVVEVVCCGKGKGGVEW